MTTHVIQEVKSRTDWSSRCIFLPMPKVKNNRSINPTTYQMDWKAFLKLNSPPSAISEISPYRKFSMKRINTTIRKSWIGLKKFVIRVIRNTQNPLSKEDIASSNLSMKRTIRCITFDFYSKVRLSDGKVKDKKSRPISRLNDSSKKNVSYLFRQQQWKQFIFTSCIYLWIIFFV